MAKLLLLLTAVAVIWYSYRWWKNEDPDKRNKSLWTYGLWGLAAVLILLTVSGRAHWITGAIGALLPMVKAMLPQLQRLLPFAMQWRKNQAQQGQLTGEWVKLKVDPLTGVMDGLVLKGSFEGQALSALSESQLKTLLGDCLDNEMKSTQLLATFLQHSYGEQWQTTFAEVLQQHSAQSQQQASSGAANGPLSVKDAYEVLGVNEDSTKEEVLKAYKSMMQKVHPDRGGSDYLTRLVSEAKDLLLKRFK